MISCIVSLMSQIILWRTFMATSTIRHILLELSAMDWISAFP